MIKLQKISKYLSELEIKFSMINNIKYDRIQTHTHIYINISN